MIESLISKRTDNLSSSTNQDRRIANLPFEVQIVVKSATEVALRAAEHAIFHFVREYTVKRKKSPRTVESLTNNILETSEE